MRKTYMWVQRKPSSLHKTNTFWRISDEPGFPHQGSLNHYHSFVLRITYA